MVLAPPGIAGAAPAGPPLAPHPAWKMQSSPNSTAPSGQFDEVSCSSANACTAVGTYLDTAGINATLAERWNGKTWQRQRTPNPASDTVPASAPTLLGVSCPAADFCDAVGAYQVGSVGISMAERWNGRGWTSQSFPVPAGSQSAGLRQVSCTSALFCAAVGSYRNSVGASLGFAATWNGSSWHLRRIPNPVGATLVGLGGLSCVTPKFCEAGGNDPSIGPFALRWNGFSWHLQDMPATPGVSSMSCASASFCEAVGAGGGDTWNGSSWSSQTIPSPAGSTSVSLRAVSCPTARFCQAVGQYSDSSGTYFALGARWNGTSWALLSTPSPSGAPYTSLQAVSCAASTACEAGGTFYLSASNLVALAESWSGNTWRIQPGVAPRGAVGNGLNAVSCVSAVFCEAVGSHPDGSDVATAALAEAWNGTRWRIQRAANPAHAANGLRMTLNGVSCVSARFCEAVGTSSSVAGGGAEAWNGSRWTLQAVPGGYLTSVSCTSAAFCIAAGGDGHVDTWNGTSWSARPSAAGFTSLSSVSCASPRSCEAVGFGPSGDEAEGWNGTSWVPQVTPTPAAGSSAGLSAVACAGLRSCEAVGSYFSNSTFQAVTLAEKWNGTAWKVQHTPNPAFSAGSYLRAVWCTSPSSCTAVGQYSVAIPFRTLAEVWDGIAWTLRSTPNRSFAGQNTFNGVSCGASHLCTAVGVTDDLGQVQATLIEIGD